MIVEQEKGIYLFKSCIRLFKGTKNSHAAVSYGVNKTSVETSSYRPKDQNQSPEVPLVWDQPHATHP